MAGKSGFSINWGGFDQMLRDAPRKLANRKRLLDTIGNMLISSTMKRFQNEEGPDGTKWEPSGRAWETGLARKGRKATEKRKAVKSRAETGRFGKTLQDTGRLRKSVSFESKTATNEVYVGSNVAYARIHQLGGKAGRGKKVTIPARPYLGISKEDQEEAQALLGEFMKGAFRR